jgi:hypothetical protein
MDQKTPVPSVAFDPSKHVIAGRQLSDGRQLFFSLLSIVEAEKGIAGVSPNAPEVTQADLERIERKVLAAVQASVPPPQFPVDIMATLAELTSTLVAVAERLQKLESAVAIHTQNFAAIMKLGGEG